MYRTKLLERKNMNMKNLMPQPSTYIDSKFHYIVTPLLVPTF